METMETGHHGSGSSGRTHKRALLPSSSLNGGRNTPAVQVQQHTSTSVRGYVGSHGNDSPFGTEIMSSSSRKRTFDRESGTARRTNAAHDTERGGEQAGAKVVDTKPRRDAARIVKDKLAPGNGESNTFRSKSQIVRNTNAVAGPSRLASPSRLQSTSPDLDSAFKISSPTISREHRSSSIATAKTSSPQTERTKRRPARKEGQREIGDTAPGSNHENVVPDAVDAVAETFFSDMARQEEIQMRKEMGGSPLWSGAPLAVASYDEGEDSVERLLESLEKRAHGYKEYHTARNEIDEFVPSNDALVESTALAVQALSSPRQISEGTDPTADFWTVCPFCSGRLPPLREVDPSFTELKFALMKIAKPAKNPRYPFSLDLDISRRLDFCNWHVALTQTIPDGLAAGFPGDIDFLAIPYRLEKPWIRREIARLARYPVLSRTWLDCVKYVDDHGLDKWRQAPIKDSAIAERMHVGYYGVTGRAIIVNHIRNLIVWGYLPQLVSYEDVAPDCDPLTIEDFVDHVMVPAAGILLILDDQGQTLEGVSDAQTSTALKPAEDIWRKSREFGQWRYRDCRESRVIRKECGKRAKEVEQMVREGRAKSAKPRGPEMKKRKRQAASARGKNAQEPVEISSDEDERPISSPALSESRKLSIEHMSAGKNAALRLGASDSLATLAESGAKARPDNGLTQGNKENMSTSPAQIPRCRSFAKTDSFTSGFGDDAFDDLDFDAIDANVSAACAGKTQARS